MIHFRLLSVLLYYTYLWFCKIFLETSLPEPSREIIITNTRVKVQKAVRACTITLLNLSPAKYEVQNILWMFGSGQSGAVTAAVYAKSPGIKYPNEPERKYNYGTESCCNHHNGKW